MPLFSVPLLVEAASATAARAAVDDVMVKGDREDRVVLIADPVDIKRAPEEVESLYGRSPDYARMEDEFGTTDPAIAGDAARDRSRR